jgi:cupin fold WbuC family metalloprotein
MGLSKIHLDDPDTFTIDEGIRSVAFFCIRRPVKIGREVIQELKNATLKYGGKNIRICLHSGPAESFHNMIILENRGEYYRPHKHLKKSDSIHIIEGEMAIFSFDDQGMVLDACRLNIHGNFIYRVEDNMYHVVMPLSPKVIYHESKLGPFLGDQDKIFPNWAPDGTDKESEMTYMKNLQKELMRIESADEK